MLIDGQADSSAAIAPTEWTKNQPGRVMETLVDESVSNDECQ